jgi:prevent-host-death family protein
MSPVPQIVPVSDMSTKQAQVLAKLDDGPIILAQRSKPAAVLVSVSEWDAIARRLEIAEALAAHWAAKRKFAENPPKMYTLEEIDEMIKAEE